MKAVILINAMKNFLAILYVIMVNFKVKMMNNANKKVIMKYYQHVKDVQDTYQALIVNFFREELDETIWGENKNLA